MNKWVRSSRCGGNGECIEAVACEKHPGEIRVRQTRENGFVSTEFHASRAEWDAFVAGIRAGDFDNLDTP